MATIEHTPGRIEHIGGTHSIIGPRVPDVDKSYEPGTDFYMYVNARWQRSVKMPSYEDDFGISEEIELQLRKTLQDALESHMRSHPGDGVSQLAKSFLDHTVQESAVSDLIHELNALDCVSTPETFAAAVGHLNSIQCRAPLSFVVNSDYYDSNKCCVYIYEASLGLPSKANYATNTTNKTLGAYQRFLKQLGDLSHVPDLEGVIKMEESLLPFLSESSELRDIAYVYNPMTITELEKKYPLIGWREALRKWGLSARGIASTKYIVTNVKYFAHLNKLLRLDDYAAIRLWMKANMLIHYVKYLPPPFDDLHYTFYEKYMRGVDKKLPQDALTLRVFMKFAPQDLSRMFVQLEVPEKIKTEATKYVRLLKSATVRRIQGLSWMEPSTKAAALRKAHAMRFQVAFPETWESETDALHIDARRPLLNLLNLAIADTKQMINDLIHLTCAKRPSKWRDGSFEVNAYYYPEGNMMTIPAGILRPPFFDTSRSDGWNLGSIGVAISHEITHGFDDDGRHFDSVGNYADWWTVSDERTYKKMSRDIIELFEGQKYMGGKVDGKLTLNENLADIGGMAIALEALKAILPKEEAAQKAAYRDFFIGFAVSWRQKDRPKKARQALLLDVHAPPYYRVNLIVHQFEEFYIAFDIKQGMKGYLAPDERITFW